MLHFISAAASRSILGCSLCLRRGCLLTMQKQRGAVMTRKSSWPMLVSRCRRCESRPCAHHHLASYLTTVTITITITITICLLTAECIRLTRTIIRYVLCEKFQWESNVAKMRDALYGRGNACCEALKNIMGMNFLMAFLHPLLSYLAIPSHFPALSSYPFLCYISDNAVFGSGPTVSIVSLLRASHQDIWYKIYHQHLHHHHPIFSSRHFSLMLRCCLSLHILLQ
jgi:hypothetical protein